MPSVFLSFLFIICSFSFASSQTKSVAELANYRGAAWEAMLK